MNTTVFLPAHIVMGQALGRTVAETDRTQVVVWKAEVQKNAPNPFSALQGQLLVVLDEAAVVTVPLDNDDQVWKIMKDVLECGGYLSQFAPLPCPKHVRVEIEVQIRRCAFHPVLHPSRRRSQAEALRNRNRGLTCRTQPATCKQHPHECARD